MVEQPPDGSVLFGNFNACRFGRHSVLRKISHITMEGALGYNSILSPTRAMQGKCVFFVCLFLALGIFLSIFIIPQLLKEHRFLLLLKTFP
ncbi:hypothetical protein V8C43DRAFT_47560 [Trichoderma afarasin]